jgi:hypothetical protein
MGIVELYLFREAFGSEALKKAPITDTAKESYPLNGYRERAPKSNK